MGIVAPFRIPTRDYLSSNRVSNVSLADFICIYPTLFPDTPVLLREKVVGKNHVNVTEGEVVRFNDILEC